MLNPENEPHPQNPPNNNPNHPSARSSEETGDLFADSVTGPITIPSDHDRSYNNLSGRTREEPGGIQGIRRRLERTTPKTRRFIRFLSGTIVFYFAISIAAIILMVACPKSEQCPDDCTRNSGKLCPSSSPCLCGSTVLLCQGYQSERCEDDFLYPAIILFILSGVILLFLVIIGIYVCYASKSQTINPDYLVVN